MPVTTSLWSFRRTALGTRGNDHAIPSLDVAGGGAVGDVPDIDPLVRQDGGRFQQCAAFNWLGSGLGPRASLVKVRAAQRGSGFVRNAQPVHTVAEET